MNALVPLLLAFGAGAAWIAAGADPDPAPPVACAGACSETAASPMPPPPVTAAVTAGRNAETMATGRQRAVAPLSIASLARLTDVVAAIDAGADGSEQVRLLRDLLVASPALVAKVADLASSPERTGRCRLRLLQALQLDGDAACQGTLAALADDPRLRDRALRALGGVASPFPASLDTLWSFACGEPESPALAAFARAAASTRDLDQALHTACCDRLRTELRRATASGPVCAWLRALRTAGDREAAELAVPFASSPDPKVRAVAASLLAASAEPRHELVLRDLLAHETDPEVRRIGTRALAMLANAR